MDDLWARWPHTMPADLLRMLAGERRGKHAKGHHRPQRPPHWKRRKRQQRRRDRRDRRIA